MKKDSLFLAIILVLGILLGIIYFINPAYIEVLKTKVLYFLESIWIVTRNKIAML